MPCDMTGLGSFPFARHYWGNRCYFLFLRVLRCFSSPRSPPGYPGMTGSRPPGCPIRKSADQRVFAPPRGLSQLVTSFFASESQGIPHTPLSSLFFRLDTRSSAVFDYSCLILCSFITLVCFSSCDLAACLNSLPLSLRGAWPPLAAVRLSPSRGKLLSASFFLQYVNVLSFLVENNGVEPLTLCLQSRCSSQLS